MNSDMRSVQLPADLCATAEQTFRERFAGIEELLAFVLRELVRDDAVRMDQDEQKFVEQRLKDLGYL